MKKGLLVPVLILLEDTNHCRDDCFIQLRVLKQILKGKRSLCSADGSKGSIPILTDGVGEKDMDIEDILLLYEKPNNRPLGRN